MTTVRLMRKVSHPWGRGPGNGQYALQRALRKHADPVLEIGGDLQDGDVPWWWCWLDANQAVECERSGRPFIIGPNMLFAGSVRSLLPTEEILCNAEHCILQFTESPWYRELIESHLGPRHAAPIVLWPYPIKPQPKGPLKARYDLLIYAKSGYSRPLVARLIERYPRSRVLKYGRFSREDLTHAARCSRACVYLSASDRGPLALAEILLAGCPAVGIERGSPWIRDGVNGARVETLEVDEIIAGVERARSLDRESVREGALAFFDEKRVVDIIHDAIRNAVGTLKTAN